MAISIFNIILRKLILRFARIPFVASALITNGNENAAKLG